ncbi:uncharacterized protein DDB_G0271670 [Stegastes partitus]|uniref:Uncharacterized protein DDB_G0271670 n=1 Tax=Stegastes partitus TaxID=144197 RepID=A0A9Y4N2T0_9TELE|nr:PREDICTED: uncharacterized protein DDB_G0271670-like [Stegastes partitus]
MNIFLLLLYCTEILGVLLFIPGRTSADTDTQNVGNVTSSTSLPKSQQDFNTTASSVSDANSSMSSEPSSAVIEMSTSRSFPPSSGPKPATATTKTTTTISSSPNEIFQIKECRSALIVSAGLILACVIFLITTLFLACRTCQLSRRLKRLGANADLISNSEYWMGTAKKDKSKSDTEGKETTVLMSDLTQEEMNNGPTKEDGGKMKEDGQKGEEKEAGDAANGEEVAAAPATVAENSSSSKPQEEAANSQPAKDAAASSSEGAE